MPSRCADIARRTRVADAASAGGGGPVKYRLPALITLLVLSLGTVLSAQGANTLRPTGGATAPDAGRLPAQTVDSGRPPDTLANPPAGQSAKDPLDIFSGGPAGYLLAQYFRTAVIYTPQAARFQRRALARLRNADPQIRKQFLSELAAAYQRLPAESYDLRWLVVDTLGQLEDPESLDYLAQLALAGLPAEKMPKEAMHQSTNDEEVAIRMAAVRGISQLAGQADPKADALLLDVARRAPVRGVRRLAMHGYMFAPRKTTGMRTLSEYRVTSVYAQRLTALKRAVPLDGYDPSTRAFLEPRLVASPPDVTAVRRQPDSKKEGREISAPPSIGTGVQ